MRVIDFGTSFKSLSVFVDHYNKGKELSDKIRQNTIATAQDLIKLYAIVLRRTENRKKQMLIEDSSWPSLATNNIQLAQRLKTSARTIQRHIKKLVEAGFITKKEWHGSQHQYELWLNVEILSPAKYVNPDTLFFKTTENQQEENFTTTSWPHTVSCTTGTNIITNKNVNSEFITSTLSTNEETGYLCESLHKAGNRSIQATPQEQVPAATERYIALLWDYAQRNLYAQRDFSTLDVLQAKRYLIPYFQNIPEERLDKLYCVYVERINLVKRYLDKDPLHRFIPMPFYYFNVQNKKGFTGTKEWYEKHQQRKEELGKESRLHQITEHYLKSLRNNYTTQDLLKVFRVCEEKVKQLKSKKLLQAFYSKVLSKGPVLFSKNR